MGLKFQSPNYALVFLVIGFIPSHQTSHQHRKDTLITPKIPSRDKNQVYSLFYIMHGNLVSVSCSTHNFLSPNSQTLESSRVRITLVFEVYRFFSSSLMTIWQKHLDRASLYCIEQILYNAYYGSKTYSKHFTCFHLCNSQ